MDDPVVGVCAGGVAALFQHPNLGEFVAILASQFINSGDPVLTHKVVAAAIVELGKGLIQLNLAGRANYGFLPTKVDPHIKLWKRRSPIYRQLFPTCIDNFKRIVTTRSKSSHIPIILDLIVDALFIVHNVDKERHLLDSFLYGEPLFIFIRQSPIQLINVVELRVKKIQELTINRVRDLNLINSGNERLCGFR